MHFLIYSFHIMHYKFVSQKYNKANDEGPWLFLFLTNF